MLAVLETIAILLIFISKSDAFFTFCKHLVLSLCSFLLTIKISVLLQKARSEIKKKGMSAHLITLKQDTEHHRCTLPGEPWDIVPKFIEGGILVDLRRKLKRYFLI